MLARTHRYGDVLLPADLGHDSKLDPWTRNAGSISKLTAHVGRSVSQMSNFNRRYLSLNTSTLQSAKVHEGWATTQHVGLFPGQASSMRLAISDLRFCWALHPVVDGATRSYPIGCQLLLAFISLAGVLVQLCFGGCCAHFNTYISP